MVINFLLEVILILNNVRDVHIVIILFLIFIVSFIGILFLSLLFIVLTTHQYVIGELDRINALVGLVRLIHSFFAFNTLPGWN
jgi:hypothetical protein